MAVSTCTGCKEVFTGLGPFDLHHKDVEQAPFVVCLSPAEIGLTQNERGQWGTKDAPFDSTYIPAAERPARDYEVECAKCGKMFMRPRKRGRPPTKCEACR